MRKAAHIWLLLFILGCEDPIQIDLPTNANLLVVQGWVTNELKNHEVVLTRTQGFNDQSGPSFVNNASVTVFDNQGEPFIFQQGRDGVYRSTRAFAGEIDALYKVEIILADGDTIDSPPVLMPRLVAIDSVAFNSEEEVSNENSNQVEIINFPVTFAQDPPDIRNYYRWKISRNDTLFDAPNDLELLDDSAINGNYFPNEFRSFRFESGDTLHVEMQSITEEAFDFLRLLKNQTTLLGTASGTLPATISGNLRNQTNEDQIVLGFFGCVATSSAELVLLEE